MKFYPEPIWFLYLTIERIERGDWLRIEPHEIQDYTVNPFADGWEARYAPSAVERIKALWPRGPLDVRSYGAFGDSADASGPQK